MCNWCESKCGHINGCPVTANDSKQAMQLFEEGRADRQDFDWAGQQKRHPSYLLGWNSTFGPKPAVADLCRLGDEAPVIEESAA